MLGASEAIDAKASKFVDSPSIVQNMGTAIIALVAMVLAMIVTLVLILLARKITAIRNIVRILKEKLFFNSVLRTCI